MGLPEETLSLLRAHAPADPDEGAALVRAQRLLVGAEAAFSRRNLVPGHFTASAVVLHPHQRAVALLLHPKLGRWLQPGGHFEPEDAGVEAAARREVGEELGLIELDRVDRELFDFDIHAIPERANEPSHDHFDLRLLFRARSDRLLPGHDIAAARWVDLSRITGLVEDPSLLRMIEKLRRATA